MIPQALAKEIKSNCQNKGEYILAFSSRRILKVNGRAGLSEQGIPVNTIEDNFQDWAYGVDGRVFYRYPSKPKIELKIEGVTSGLIIDRNQDRFGGQGEFITDRRYLEITSADYNTYINDVLFYNGRLSNRTERNIYTEETNGVTRYFRDTDLTTSLISTIRTYPVSCRCPDGEDIDCPGQPDGYCCISYATINAACSSLQ
jgi:hypothetical protein